MEGIKTVESLGGTRTLPRDQEEDHGNSHLPTGCSAESLRLLETGAEPRDQGRQRGSFPTRRAISPSSTRPDLASVRDQPVPRSLARGTLSCSGGVMRAALAAAAPEGR